MKYKVFVSILAIICVVSSCKLDHSKKKKDNVTTTSTPSDSVSHTRLDSTLIVSDSISTVPSPQTKTILSPSEKPYDTLTTATAQFIAAMDTSLKFKGLREKDYYKNYKQTVNADFESIKKARLNSINQWVIQNNINTAADSATLFYPFSGPDFLYADAFFPNCKNYVLVGLEKLGNLPKINTLKDTMLSKYLGNIRYSLRCMNKLGYFITQQMSGDFSKSNLDGVAHILSYYVARSGAKITQFSHVYLDQNGKPQSVEFEKLPSKKIQGIRIDFLKNNVAKTLYYFRVDLSDKSLNEKPEFYGFLSDLGTKYTYVKSASYILHNAGFVGLRNYIMKYSKKLLQDDTGIPYWCLKKSNFDVKLFGNYTRTISDFKYLFQKDLAADLEKEKNPLPFHIGYNASYKETVLIYAQNNGKKVIDDTKEPVSTEEKKQQIADNKVVYRIQFKMSSFKIEETNFKDLPEVCYYIDNGVYKYTVGNLKTPEECRTLQQKVKNQGFTDAFVVAFYNGKRISMDEARKLASNK